MTRMYEIRSGSSRRYNSSRNRLSKDEPLKCDLRYKRPTQTGSQPGVTAEDDIASVAAQLADLTRKVDEMQGRVNALSERADSQQSAANTQQERTDIQQERIELAARELADVSERLQAAANALRESI